MKSYKISILTPFHWEKPTYLKDCWESLKSQTYQNFEWVLVPNNKGLMAKLKEFQDPKIKIVPFKEETDWIGAIKNFAFFQASGDILLELDWDDILMPTALEEVNQAFQDLEIGFVYSNAVYFNDEDYTKPQRFNQVYGWQWRDFEYQKHQLDEIISFLPTPASVSKIWFAPDHLRAWRKDIYYQLGGHNKEMRVLDDGDLICRTYLITKFKHIDKPLYLYRIHKNNTWATIRNQEIQNNVMRIYDIYIYDLCKRWAELNNLLVIDLGGAFGCPDGWKSVDLKNADFKMDLNKKWKLKDNSVGVIRAFNVMEHIKDKVHFINETYRVLVDGGYILSMTPSALGQGAFQDFDHKSYWVENSFWYCTKSFYQKFNPEIKARFCSMRLETCYPTPFEKAANIPYVKWDAVKLPTKEKIPGIIEI